MLTRKVDVYAEQGCRVSVNTSPFAVLIQTPLMQRAQQLSEAACMTFVDSTASCDADSNSITFMLTACAAGAVPLAVIITGGQSEADYLAGFSLYKAGSARGFGGAMHPQIFMTDDADAEHLALSKAWPEAEKMLCLFHVQQAHWRWLWAAQNSIEKVDRPLCISQFRRLMVASTIDEAEKCYNEILASPLCSKYPNWRCRIEAYWVRRKRWCMAWRSPVIRGHHMNNFSEVSVRLFKDIVLSRTKAYNVVALVDFVVTTMEQYYVQRLRNFANSRDARPELLWRKQLAKCAYITSPDDIIILGDSVFEVPSEADPSMKYVVDASCGACSCAQGRHGRYCKHQAAVLKYFPAVVLPNTPAVTATARHAIAVLALGDAAEPLTFYSPFSVNADLPSVYSMTTQRGMAAQATSTSNSQPNGDSAVSDVDSDNESAPSLVQTFCQQFSEKYAKFGSSSACEKGLKTMIKSMTSVQTEAQLLQFLSMDACGSVRKPQRGAIKVQSTSLARRKEGVTRGSKRRACGRPPTADAKQRKAKRPRNLSYNVSQNQPNAKSHGEGH